MNFGVHFVSAEQAATFGQLLVPQQVAAPHPSGLGYLVDTGPEQSFSTPDSRAYLDHLPALSVATALQELARSLSDPFRPFERLLLSFARLAERAQFDERIIAGQHLGVMMRVLARRPDPPGLPPDAPSRQRFCELAGTLLGGAAGLSVAAELLRAGHIWQRLMDSARAELAEIPRLEQNQRGQVLLRTAGGLSQIISQAETNEYVARHQELVALSASIVADLGALLGDLDLIGDAR